VSERALELALSVAVFVRWRCLVYASQTLRRSGWEREVGKPMMMMMMVSNGYHATTDLQTLASPGGGRQDRAVAVVNGGEWELRAPRQRLSMFWPSVCSTAGRVKFFL
jgi:hypothetical protein